jgi:hypothetical protein
MKVFISWSGRTSQAVALALRDWLPSVLQSIDPYMSSEDIEKGARWSIEIGRELDNTSFGILCVTPDNVESSWLNFEAGALAKSIDSSHVSPVLVGLRPADLVGPLAQFQATLPEQDDIARLLSTINANSEHAIEESRLRDAVRIWWPQLEERLQAALELDSQAPESHRTVPDMIVELLEITRGLQKQALREDRIWQEPTSLVAYEYAVVQAIIRNLPSNANIGSSPGPGDYIIQINEHRILVDIKHSYASYTADLQRLFDDAQQLSLKIGKSSRILLVTRSLVPYSVQAQVDQNSMARWVFWASPNDDAHLRRAKDDLAGGTG